MNNENNISLTDLKNHEVVPPSFLLNKIKSKIEEADDYVLKNAFSGLLTHQIQPPTNSYQAILQKINGADELSTFKQLKNYEVQPPLTFQKLMEIIKSMGLLHTSKQGGKVVSFSIYKKIAAAAAVVIFAISTFLVLNKNKSQTTANSLTVSSNLPSDINTQNLPTPVVGDTTPLPNAKNDVAIVNNSSIKSISDVTRKTKLAQVANKKSKIKSSIKYGFASSFNLPKSKKQPQFLIDGVSFPLMDDDYLATFASFDSSNMPEFLKSENPFLKSITIDKYSYFEISEGMSKIMKKMYSTKSNGTPTRKARKQKAKIEKWKTADSTFFYQNSNLNPLDPRDLSNFILNK